MREEGGMWWVVAVLFLVQHDISEKAEVKWGWGGVGGRREGSRN